jgi:hypothetical protein
MRPVLQSQLHEALSMFKIDLVLAVLRHKLFLLAADEDQQGAALLQVVIRSLRSSINAARI